MNTYRLLLPADYGSYKRVRLDCLRQYPDNFGNTYEEEANAHTLKLSDAIQHADEFNFVFGAFDTEKLIGICGLITGTRIKTRHRGEIVQMFVDESYKGQGIGKQLLQLCIDKAFANEETEQITLSAVASNKQAVNLYESLGFREYGHMKNYFKSENRYFDQSFFYLVKDKSGKH